MRCSYQSAAVACALALFTALAGAQKKAVWTPLRAGDRAPSFAIKTMDGATVSSEDLRGKVVLLNFWGTYCGGCVADIPKLEAMQKQYGADGLVVLWIAFDEDPEKWRAWLRRAASRAASFATARAIATNLRASSKRAMCATK